MEILKNIPSNSIDMVITSPPYFGLRQYSCKPVVWDNDNGCEHDWVYSTKKGIPGGIKSEKVGIKGVDNFQIVPDTEYGFCSKCQCWKGELGQEPHHNLFIEHLTMIFMECSRILKPEGSMWINIADSYSGNNRGAGAGGKTGEKQKTNRGTNFTKEKGYLSLLSQQDIKNKSLMCIPDRLKIALVDSGLICRNEIIWCLAGTTNLYVKSNTSTRNMEGIRNVKDIYRHGYEGTLLWNGANWTKILNVFKSTEKNGKIIKLRSGEKIIATDEHLFPTTKGNKSVKELAIGDVLLKCKLPEGELTSDVIDYKLGWFLGLYLAEGNIEPKRETIELSGNKNELEFRNNFLIPLCNRFHGKIYNYVDGNTLITKINCPLLVTIIKKYISGKTSKDKYVSNCAYEVDNEFIKGILDGYLDGDGHFDSKNNRYRLGFTDNLRLEESLRIICAKLDYKIIMNKGKVKAFNSEYNIIRGEIRKEISDHQNCKDMQEIISIEPTNLERDFYDIEVEDSPNLFSLATGTLTHNCKPNQMPSSAKDRFTNDFEKFYFFTKSNKYYFEQQFEPYTEKMNRWGGTKLKANGKSDWDEGTGQDSYRDRNMRPNEKGKNQRTVWSINTKPNKETHFACVDENTECLTIDGWKHHWEINKESKILTYNIDGDFLEYSNAINVYEYPYKGELYKIGNRDLNILVTNNHRNIILDKNKDVKVKESQDLSEQDKILTASVIKDNSLKSVYSENEYALLGWFLTEGSMSKYSQNIYQNSGKNADKIRSLLSVLEIPFDEYIKNRNGKQTNQITFHISQKYKILRKMVCTVDNYSKVPVRGLLNAEKTKLESLFNSMILGDGSTRSDGRVTFTQKNKIVTDFFQELCVLLGKRCVVSYIKELDIFHCYVTKRKWSGIRGTNGESINIKLEKYNGVVWCVNTMNGTFVARRSGRVFITGNSYPQELLTIPIKSGCPVGGIVLDPFFGSGTTGIAARDLNRNWIGLELNPDYVEIANKRLGL